MWFAVGKKRPSNAVKRVATKRLSVDGRGRVVYQYKHSFRDGSTHVVLLGAMPIYKLSQFRTWPI